MRNTQKTITNFSQDSTHQATSRYNCVIGRLLIHYTQKATCKNSKHSKNIVVFEPDIAQAFPEDDAVNQALRPVLKAAKIPQQISIHKPVSEEKPNCK
ncbi:MAG: hypothetical protein R6W69_02815 [Anaerolineales bacterium]